MSASIKDLKIDLNNLDKSNWKTYRFDEIAKNISERVDPNNTDLEVYIGLEHIDSSSIHIKRHGLPDEVNGTKLKFYKGDVIFGRRRAYQRKAGIATWDGFCSAHALVLRANPDVIDPELFPFFMHSDLFMNRAIDISVGSLSPTINWGTLKHQEFLVPPKGIQANFIKLLSTMDCAIQKHKNTISALKTAKKSKLKSYYSNEVEYKQIRDIGEIVTGSTPSTKKEEYWGEDFQFVTPADISDDTFYVLDTERKITGEGLSVSREIPADSLMVVCIASIGKLAISQEKCGTNQQINTIIPNDGIEVKYLYEVLELFNELITSKAAKSVVPILNKGDFGLIKIPILKPDLRRQLLNESEYFDNCIQNSTVNIKNSEQLQISILNKVF